MNMLKTTIVAALILSATLAHAYDVDTEIAISNARIEAQSYYNYLTTLDWIVQSSIDKEKNAANRKYLIKYESCQNNAIKENYSDCMKRRANE